MDLLTAAGLTCEDVQSDVIHYLVHISQCEECQAKYPKLAEVLKK
jgi:hypothetical protein